MNFSTNKLVPILLAIAALVAGVLFSLNMNKPTAVDQTSSNISRNIQGLLWPNPKQLSAFTLTDQNGHSFDLNNLTGQWSMMFFGYTHCPDVCPITMSLLNTVAKDLVHKEPQPQIIFVTIDPERDTQQHLAGYISYFNPDFTALTGSEEDIAVLTKQLGILSMKVNNENSSNEDEYLMDHTSSILLLDKKARLVGIFSAPHEKEDIEQRYLAITEFIGQQK